MNRMRVVVVLVGLALAACGKKAAAPAQSVIDLGPNPGVSYTPDPIAVTVAVDAGTAVTRSVLYGTGATLTTIGVDGTTYELDVPADALFGDETITMTPMTGVTGLPGSFALTAGVQLEPEGLAFMTPATLRITPPSAPPAGAIGFSYEGGGSGFYLCDGSVSAGAVTLSLDHFSGRGVITGTPADESAQGAHNPPSPEQAAEQRLKILFDQKKAEGSWPSDDELFPIYRDWFNGSIRPGLTAALSDVSALMCSGKEFLAWDRQMALLGGTLQTRFPKERAWGFQTIAQATKNGFDAALKKCFDDHDPYQAGVLIELSRQAALMNDLGGDYSKYYQGIFDMNYALQQAATCARFEVTFDSQIDLLSGGSQFQFHTTTTSPAIVQADPADHLVLKYAWPDQNGTPATTALHLINVAGQAIDSSTPNFLWVKSMRMKLDNPLTCSSAKPPLPFDVIMGFGVMDLTTGWGQNFSHDHAAEYDASTYAWWATDFVKGTAGVFAQKVYSMTGCTWPSCTGSEQTTITVKHAPQQ